MHPLQTLLVEAGLKPRSYSGRGMYGKYCLSANIDRGGLGPFMAKLVRALPHGDPVNAGDVDPEEIAEALEGLSTDSMGLGMVVYFPGVPFEGESEEDDGEDEDEDENENHDLELSDDEEDEG